jgi:hypothetical protein
VLVVLVVVVLVVVGEEGVVGFGLVIELCSSKKTMRSLHFLQMQRGDLETGSLLLTFSERRRVVLVSEREPRQGDILGLRE